MDVQISTRISPWVFTIAHCIQKAPWAFRWIGEERIIRWVVRFGVRVEIS